MEHGASQSAVLCVVIFSCFEILESEMVAGFSVGAVCGFGTGISVGGAASLSDRSAGTVRGYDGIQPTAVPVDDRAGNMVFELLMYGISGRYVAVLVLQSAVAAYLSGSLLLSGVCIACYTKQ